MSKQFKKFMTSYGPVWMTISILNGLLMVTSLISMIIRDDLQIAPQIVMFIIEIITLIPLMISSKFFKKLEEEVSCEAINEEFEKALPMMKDTVRYGENYIFRKRKAKLLRYDEIKQVYQSIHRTNFVEDGRSLNYIDLKGKHHEICKLELREKSNEDLKIMIAIILTKNPNVKIGYR